MLQAVLPIALLCGFLWLLRECLRRFVLRSPLDNIPGPSSKSFVYGNLEDLVKLDSWPFHDDLVEKYPGIARLQGPFGGRILYVFDPNALHHVLVKHQYVYEEARFFTRSHELFLGKGLLATLGEHHRKQRKLLNPVFSPQHMRYMIPMFYKIGDLLVEAIQHRVKQGEREVDMAMWFGRTALELIGQAGLGYSFGHLVDDDKNEFAVAIKGFTHALGSVAVIRRIVPYLPTIRFAGIGRRLFDMVPHDGVKRLLEISDILWDRSIAIYDEKKRALEEGDAAVAKQVGEGKDIMSILLKANVKASDDDKLDEDEIIAQMSTFILGAVDTTSNALSAILWRLAENSEVQQKLREEIINANADKGVDYDTLVGLPYLEAVCRETLRLHAPLPQTFRETLKDIVLPLSTPIIGVDGKTIHEITVPKNTTVVVGIMNCNRNKGLWGADAYEWKPERWLSPLPAAVKEARIPGIYSNIMTFSGGGRACIGFKFAQLEIKVLLSLLLANFTFEPTDQPIIWNLGGIRYPSLANDRKKISLPMKVGIYTRGA